MEITPKLHESWRWLLLPILTLRGLTAKAMPKARGFEAVIRGKLIEWIHRWSDPEVLQHL